MGASEVYTRNRIPQSRNPSHPALLRGWSRRIGDHRTPVSNDRCRVRVSCFSVFQVSGFGFGVSGFRFQIAGSRFQVAGLRFHVSGFRIQVSGFRVERLVIYCQTTGVSAAHATHCATYCTPCRPLIRAFSGWIRTPPPTGFGYL